MVSPWHLWREDKAEVVRQVAEGLELEGHTSAFGDNDLIIGFLMVEGFWSVLVDTKADGLKKDNGYPPRILNGLWALCELAGVERVARSGKVLGDEALLRMVGFQAEHIEQTLLRYLLKQLREQFGRLGEWMKVLVMDRGYWGARLLLDLKRQEGVDFVTRAGNHRHQVNRL